MCLLTLSWKMTKKEKKLKKLNKQLFILKIWIFYSQNDHKLSTKKQKSFHETPWEGKQLDLMLVRFDINWFFIIIVKKWENANIFKKTSSDYNQFSLNFKTQR